MAKKQKDIDAFELYGLDRNDPMTGSFLKAATIAFTEFYDLFEEDKALYPAFNSFVAMWQFHSVLSEDTNAKIKNLLEILRKMWNDAASSQAERFCALCHDVNLGKTELADELCATSLEVMEAIFVMNGNLPRVNSIFEAAMVTASRVDTCPKACLALLNILCARIWYKSFGLSGVEELAMLSEGIKYHLQSRCELGVNVSELYALNIAAAIYDIVTIRTENGLPDEEKKSLIREAYTILSRFNSPSSDMQRERPFQCSGLTAQDCLS